MDITLGLAVWIVLTFVGPVLVIRNVRSVLIARANLKKLRSVRYSTIPEVQVGRIFKNAFLALSPQITILVLTLLTILGITLVIGGVLSIIQLLAR